MQKQDKKVKSLFRLEQDAIVARYAHEYKPTIVIELGGDPKNNYRSYFPVENEYILTNVSGPCDEIEDITDLTYANNSVESILCISVLQHVFELDKAISEIIRVLRPGGSALITNGFLFPICMDDDYYRLTPAFWKKRLDLEGVSYKLINLSGRYGAIENMLNRPYGQYSGLGNIMRKVLALPFTFLRKFTTIENNYPLGIGVVLIKK
jgi:SAM-dependent methyltransferase